METKQQPYILTANILLLILCICTKLKEGEKQ
jgi:hypothetical protein